MCIRCKICGNESSLFDSAVILNKYDVKYYQCPSCGFVQTEEPYWLNEAYSSAITSSDIGLIQRNISLSERLHVVLKVLGEVKLCLDYGGGYGMFVRLMRDKGWNFEWYDDYCQNLFARSHELSHKHYDVVTSFEMMEHLPHPYETMDKIFTYGDNVVLSTNLLPNPTQKVLDWWYFGTDHGQHVSFYTKKSMDIIAHKYGRHYFYSFGLHFFLKKKSYVLRFLIKVGLLFVMFYQAVTKMMFRRKSLLLSDYYDLTGKNLK